MVAQWFSFHSEQFFVYFKESLLMIRSNGRSMIYFAQLVVMSFFLDGEMCSVEESPLGLVAGQVCLFLFG